MKFLIRSTLAVLALALMAPSAAMAQQQGSIVFLDSERLRQEAPSLQAARQQLEQELAQLEAQADSALAPLQAQLQAAAQEFQQQQGMMTAERRQERQQALGQMQQQLQQQGAQWEQRAAAIQSRILGPALDRINRVIDEIRAENSYQYVLDVAAGGVVAADPALDITGEVLTRLQATNPGS
ncbi:MAG: OmpH family outer membrane protein [Longimicrobiales bacterium]|nr:OmpH family outer membrane protein [Longimicrobiales bacterium]